MFNPNTIQPDTLSLYSYLPQFVRDNDADGGYQFLAWLDGVISMGSAESTLDYQYAYNNGNLSALAFPYTTDNDPVPAATGLQAIDDIVRDSPYNPGYSILLDISRCPTYALPWLGQFVGVQLLPGTPDAAMRASIVAESSFNRGTLSAIQSAADAQMVPGYVVDVQERTSLIGGSFGYDAYALVITYPLAGVNSLTYGQLLADYTSFAAVQSAYSTFGAMAGYTANLETAVLAAVPAGTLVYFNPF